MKLYIVICICFAVAYGSIPSGFPQCKRSDPNIEKCILDGIEVMKPRLSGGFPEINVPPLDPFKIDLLQINSSITGSSLQATVTNVVAYGGSNFKIENLKVDLDGKYNAELKITFPLLKVTADYNTQGTKMLFFQIQGDGKFKASLSNVAVVVKCIASPVVKNGVEYLQLDSIVTKVNIGDADMKVIPSEGSFTVRAAAAFVSTTPSVVLKVFRPVIDESTATVVKKYIDDVLASTPLKDVLID